VSSEKKGRIERLIDNVGDAAIAEASRFSPDRSWRAGSITGPNGNMRTVETDGIAEDMLVQAVIRVAADSKVVDELLARTQAVLTKYVRSAAFEKRIHTYVEKTFDAMLEAFLSGDEDRLDDAIRDDLKTTYLETLRERWPKRVEVEVEKVLTAALAEVKAKVGA
jgi:hypothetical protein